MDLVKRGRRRFLVGMGGFTLALPVLSSLEPRTARAGTTPRQKRFVGFATGHGAIWTENMFPSDALLTEEQALFSDHLVRRGTLVAGSDGALSSVLAAPDLTPDRIAKLNVIRGLDLPFYLGHNTGVLGNFGRSDRETEDAYRAAFPYTPTIDQVMALSGSFYRSESYLVRSIHVGYGPAEISWTRSSSGRVEPVRRTHDSAALFDSIFVAPSTPAPVDPRVSVVDRVLEHYRRVQSGTFGDARRLSTEDRRRLSDHMDRLAELQARIDRRAMALSCGEIERPSGYVGGQPEDTLASTLEYHRIMNEIIAAAFICGTSSVATVFAYEPWSDYDAATWPEDRSWHTVAHTADRSPARQGLVVDAHRRFFSDAFLDLARRLDVEEADGQTYLDNSLLMWTQESGASTHDPISIPVVTAGSAGGFLRTGQYVDYTNRANTALSRNGDGETVLGRLHPGIFYTQWLGTVLQSMGLAPSEYETADARGYGGRGRERYYQGSDQAWPERLFDIAGGVVPFLGA